MKRIVSFCMSLALLASAIPPVGHAAAMELASDYESAKYVTGSLDGTNIQRDDGYVVKYTYGFDASTLSRVPAEYTGANATATNQWGVEVAVNAYGYVTAVEQGVGNMAIPEDGFVLSAHDNEISTGASTLLNNVVLGDYIATLDRNGDGNDDAYGIYRVTADSKFGDEQQAFTLPYSALSGSYSATVTTGGTGVTTGGSVWQTDILVKKTGTVSGYPTGYVVAFGGCDIDVPSGYFAITIDGQSVADNGGDPYTAAQTMKDFASVGAAITCTASGVSFQYDAAAAIRAAYLLTGLTNSTVTTVYDFSAHAKLQTALTEYKLVDTDAMTTLYNTMAQVTQAASSLSTKAALEPYLATIYQSYEALCALEFEKRSVEMRATWLRPFDYAVTSPAFLSTCTATELDTILEDAIKQRAALGYNMLFVEAFYNSTTIFPIPEHVGYNGLHFEQAPCFTAAGNPNLTEDYDALQRFIDICKRYDIEPHVWWEVFFVGYENTPESPVQDALFEYSVAYDILNNPTTYEGYLNESNTGKMYYTSSGDGENQYFLNPASTGARTFLINSFMYIWETYDIVSFQLDYIRYPHTTLSDSFGYDDATIAAFLREYPQYNEYTMRNDVSFYFYNEDWYTFRADFVTTFVRDVSATLRSVRPDIYLTAAPAAQPNIAIREIMQDTYTWIEEGYVDVLFPMAYGEHIPGYITADIVSGNPDKYVCVGVTAAYQNTPLRYEWIREIRDGGADGTATFNPITEYADDIWSNTAVTPLQNSARAARSYLTETAEDRLYRINRLGDMTAAQLSQALELIRTADQTIRLYGMEATQTDTALRAIISFADTLSGDPAAAIKRDVDYLYKIRGNSRDAYKQDRQLSNGYVDGSITLTVNGVPLNNTSDSFTYTAATDTLYIRENAVLCGTLPDSVTVLIGEDVTALTLDSLSLYSLERMRHTTELTICLLGDTVLSVPACFDATYIGTGSLGSGKETVMCKGDVNGSEALDTTDVRQMLQYCVGKITLNTYKISVADTNGDKSLTTDDVRAFLKAIL